MTIITNRILTGLIVLMSVVILLGILIVPASAVDTENPITTELDSGWTVATNGYPSGSLTSWFNIVRQLILTGNTTLEEVQTRLTNYYIDALRQNWTVNGGYNALWGNNSWFNVVNSNLLTTRLAVQGLATATQMTSYFDSLKATINADTTTLVSAYSTGVGTITNTLDEYLGTYNSYSAYVHPIIRADATHYASSVAGQSTPNVGRYPLMLIYNENGRLYLSDQGKTVTSPMDMLSILNTNSLMIGNELLTLNTEYRSTTYNMANGTAQRYQAYSIGDILDVTLQSLVDSAGRLAYILADDDAIAVKKSNSDNISAVVNDFFNPSTGNNSIKLSDIGSVSDLGSHFSGSLNSGGSISGFISGTSSSGGLFSWFSEDCVAELDSTLTSNSLRLMSKGTSQYDNYYYQLNLGENDLYD